LIVFVDQQSGFLLDFFQRYTCKVPFWLIFLLQQVIIASHVKSSIFTYIQAIGWKEFLQIEKHIIISSK